MASKKHTGLTLTDAERRSCAGAVGVEVLRLIAEQPEDAAHAAFNRSALLGLKTLLAKLRSPDEAAALADKSQDCDEDGEPLNDDD